LDKHLSHVQGDEQVYAVAVLRFRKASLPALIGELRLELKPQWITTNIQKNSGVLALTLSHRGTKAANTVDVERGRK
jgi:hypothetical protein